MENYENVLYYLNLQISLPTKEGVFSKESIISENALRNYNLVINIF